MRLHRLHDCIRDRLKLISTKARRNENGPRMPGVGRDRLVGKLDEVNDIRCNNCPSIARRVGQLSPIVQLNIARLVGGRSVHAFLSEKRRDGRR